MKTYYYALVLLVTSLAASPLPATAATPEETAASEAKYTSDIEKRTTDILALLDINNTTTTAHVHDAIIAQYRALRDWHDVNDPKIKAAGTNKAAVAEIRTSLKTLHDQYLVKLSADLTPEQVEKVKDKMTYGKVQFTFNGYLNEYSNLTDAQKEKVLGFLKEAREEGMDGGSSHEKDDIFNRYKGRINNYLSAQGVVSNRKKAAAGTNAPAAK